MKQNYTELTQRYYLKYRIILREKKKKRRIRCVAIFRCCFSIDIAYFSKYERHKHFLNLLILCYTANFNSILIHFHPFYSSFNSFHDSVVLTPFDLFTTITNMKKRRKKKFLCCLYEHMECFFFSIVFLLVVYCPPIAHSLSTPLPPCVRLPRPVYFLFCKS